MAPWSSLEAAHRQAAVCGFAAAVAAISSQLYFFLAHPLRIAPAGMLTRLAFRCSFTWICRCCSGAVYEVASVGQLPMDDAAPAQLGHHWPLARHLRPPNPPGRRAVLVCGHLQLWIALECANVLLQPVWSQIAAGGVCSDAK